jgi:hypothetical protein
MSRLIPAASGVVALVAAVTLASCAAQPDPAPSPLTSATESDLGVLGAAGCEPPSPSLGEVVQATGSDGITAFGLLFGAAADAIAGDGSTVKMAVRMTGDGELTVRLIRPDGSEQPLAWGPERHGGSNFDRPGDEWGIGFAPDEPGCWQIAFERGDADRADFWFDVRERPK